jgi:hypothetical protein
VVVLSSRVRGLRTSRITTGSPAAWSAFSSSIPIRAGTCGAGSAGASGARTGRLTFRGAGGGAGSGGSGDLDLTQEQIIAQVKQLMPSRCKFGNQWISINGSGSDTIQQRYGSVPICVIEQNFKEW